MAARYVNTENVAAQGQSFYTGLLPGSYEKGGGGGGSNVMGRGSGGTAGVTADRTASEAAAKSIKGYPKGGTILGKQPLSDTDRIVDAINAQGGNISAGAPGQQGAPGAPGTAVVAAGAAAPPPPSEPQARAHGWAGGEQGKPPPTPVNATRGVTTDADSKEITTGSSPKALGPAPKALNPGTQHQAADKIMPQAERLKWAAAGLPNPPNSSGQNPFGHDKGQGMGSMITGAPFGGVGQGTRTPQGLGTGQKPQHGPVQSIASSRSHTRQSGVQQSATQQSIPFPNMPNSTNRSLNF